MTTYLDVARAVLSRAGGDPVNAGPLAQWAETHDTSADSRLGVIVGRDGTILAETEREPGATGADVAGTYVTSCVTTSGVDLLVVGHEVGMALGRIRNAVGQDVIHLRAHEMRVVGGRTPASQLRAAARHTALAKLEDYRTACEQRDEHVRAAAVAGASQSEIARVSGLTRVTVAKILKEGASS